MLTNEIIEHFSRIQNRLTGFLPTKLRPILRNQSLEGIRASMIVGPRGVGKTTWLLRESTREKILYISVDNPIVAQTNLSELADAAFGLGYVGIIFDEVHYAQNWSAHIKAIYDSYPNKKIWISDSCSLVLRLSTADLTRRFPKRTVPLLSFREYLSLKHNIEFQAFDPFTAQHSTFQKFISQVNILDSFNSYKKEGFRPIFLEGEYSEKIQAIIEKTIYHDVPFFVPRVHENHLRLMSAVIGYLSVSPIPTINIESFAREWSIGKEKIYHLLE